MDILNQRINERRLAQGLTLAQVAEKLGVKEATVQRYESGDIKNIKHETIYKLSIILKCTPAYLMGWEDDSSPDEKSSFSAPRGMLPVVGCIPAGSPVLAAENIECYMPALVDNDGQHFYLRVKGDSMTGAGIVDGDVVLIDMSADIDDGSIVACRVNGDEATLKRIRFQTENVILMPENTSYSPIIVSAKEFENGYASVIGVATQVIHPLK